MVALVLYLKGAVKIYGWGGIGPIVGGGEFTEMEGRAKFECTALEGGGQNLSARNLALSRYP